MAIDNPPMAASGLEQLFKAGQIPRGADFATLIYSCYNKVDSASLDYFPTTAPSAAGLCPIWSGTVNNGAGGFVWAYPASAAFITIDDKLVLKEDKLASGGTLGQVLTITTNAGAKAWRSIAASSINAESKLGLPGTVNQFLTSSVFGARSWQTVLAEWVGVDASGFTKIAKSNTTVQSALAALEAMAIRNALDLNVNTSGLGNKLNSAIGNVPFGSIFTVNSQTLFDKVGYVLDTATVSIDNVGTRYDVYAEDTGLGITYTYNERLGITPAQTPNDFCSYSAASSASVPVNKIFLIDTNGSVSAASGNIYVNFNTSNGRKTAHVDLNNLAGTIDFYQTANTLAEINLATPETSGGVYAVLNGQTALWYGNMELDWEYYETLVPIWYQVCPGIQQPASYSIFTNSSSGTFPTGGYWTRSVSGYSAKYDPASNTWNYVYTDRMYKCTNDLTQQPYTAYTGVPGSGEDFIYVGKKQQTLARADHITKMAFVKIPVADNTNSERLGKQLTIYGSKAASAAVHVFGNLGDDSIAINATKKLSAYHIPKCFTLDDRSYVQLSFTSLGAFILDGNMYSIARPAASGTGATDGCWGNEAKIDSSGFYKRYSLDEAEYNYLTSTVPTQQAADPSKAPVTLATTSELTVNKTYYTKNGIQWNPYENCAVTASVQYTKNPFVTDFYFSGLPIIDGTTIEAGTRILVKNQTTAISGSPQGPVSDGEGGYIPAGPAIIPGEVFNGIYITSTGRWTRATDADDQPTPELIVGATYLTLSGNINKNKTYILSANQTIPWGYPAGYMVIETVMTGTVPACPDFVLFTPGTNHIFLEYSPYDVRLDTAIQPEDLKPVLNTNVNGYYWADGSTCDAGIETIIGGNNILLASAYYPRAAVRSENGGRWWTSIIKDSNITANIDSIVKLDTSYILVHTTTPHGLATGDLLRITNTVGAAELINSSQFPEISVNCWSAISVSAQYIKLAFSGTLTYESGGAVIGLDYPTGNLQFEHDRFFATFRLAGTGGTNYRMWSYDTRNWVEIPNVYTTDAIPWLNGAFHRMVSGINKVYASTDLISTTKILSNGSFSVNTLTYANGIYAYLVNGISQNSAPAKVYWGYAADDLDGVNWNQTVPSAVVNTCSITAATIEPNPRQMRVRVSELHTFRVGEEVTTKNIVGFGSFANNNSGLYISSIEGDDIIISGFANNLTGTYSSGGVISSQYLQIAYMQSVGDRFVLVTGEASGCWSSTDCVNWEHVDFPIPADTQIKYHSSDPWNVQKPWINVEDSCAWIIVDVVNHQADGQSENIYLKTYDGYKFELLTPESWLQSSDDKIGYDYTTNRFIYASDHCMGSSHNTGPAGFMYYGNGGLQLDSSNLTGITNVEGILKLNGIIKVDHKFPWHGLKTDYEWLCVTPATSAGNFTYATTGASGLESFQELKNGTVYTISYTYTAGGDILTETKYGKTTTYTYDANERLTGYSTT